MSDFKGLLMGILVVAILHVLDRYLPKWFGAIPGIAFLLLMIYVIFTKDQSLLTKLTVLIVGEALLNGIWLEALEDRKKKASREIEKMKAKDLSRK
jgi:predicted outer membrane lipoprotein